MPIQQYPPSPNLLVLITVELIGQPEPMKQNGAFPCQIHT